jgi:hypothetical protein
MFNNYHKITFFTTTLPNFLIFNFSPTPFLAETLYGKGFGEMLSIFCQKNTVQGVNSGG